MRLRALPPHLHTSMSLLTRFRTQLTVRPSHPSEAPTNCLQLRPLHRSLATSSGTPAGEPIDLERGPSRTPFVFGIVALSMIGAYWMIRDVSPCERASEEGEGARADGAEQTPIENGASSTMEDIMEPIVESNKGNRH